MRPSLHRFRLRLFSVIAQAHTNTVVLALERKRDQLVVLQVIGVPNDIGAGFVHAEHHESSLVGKRTGIQKPAHKLRIRARLPV